MTTGNRPKATHVGPLVKGPLNAEAYRLEDGRRMLSGAGMIKALGGPAKDANLGRYIERIPGVSAAVSSRPSIEFSLPTNGVAHGYEASFFVEVVGLYADALVAGTLHPKQLHMGRAAYQIQKALAGVGLEALVDEAVGYVAAPGERLNAFEKFIADQRDPWRRTLTVELQAELCRLYSKGEKQYEDDRPRPPRFLIGLRGWINKMIYGDTLALAVGTQRKALSAKTNVQVITDLAKEFTKTELEKVLMLARESRDADEFKRKVRFHFRGEALQTGWL
jgi:hypothetical protein